MLALWRREQNLSDTILRPHSSHSQQLLTTQTHDVTFCRDRARFSGALLLHLNAPLPEIEPQRPHVGQAIHVHGTRSGL